MAKRDGLIPEGEAPENVPEITPDMQKDKTLVATQEELFAARLAEIEDDIVGMFSQGASLSQIQRRFPKYTPAQVAQVIESRLTGLDGLLSVLPGMQMRGFSEDLRQLTLLIEDKSCDSKDKLKALELRTKTRQSMIAFLQDQGLLNKVHDDSGANNNDSLFGLKPSEVVINFNKIDNPADRQKYIEDLAANNGK